MKKLLLLAALAACGGKSGGGAARPRSEGPTGARELVLYRDGALVRERHDVNTEVGAVKLSLQLPQDVGARGIVARVVDGEAEVAALTVADPMLQVGDPVEILDGGRSVKGILRMIDGGSLVIENDTGVRLILDPRHVVRDVGGGAGRHVEIEVRATKAGHATVEVLYTTHKLSWSADYTLVTDGAIGQAELHGALGIENTTGIAFDDASLVLIDTPQPTRITAFDQAATEDTTPKPGSKPAPVADPTKPRAEQPVKEKKPVETPRTVLPFTVDVHPGAQSVSLLDGVHTLPAAETLVYDPVGDDINRSGREPYSVKDYGLKKKSTAVSQSIDIDLAKANVPSGLPAGRVRLLERAVTGELTPLGESRIFERASSDSSTIAPTTTVPVGRATMVEGKRTRREYSYDSEAKRLIEEFEIELTSTADHPIDVIVREHLYRGLNWTLAYHNGEKVVKEGPQKIAIKTRVPAKGTSRVVYRVVYHW